MKSIRIVSSIVDNVLKHMADLQRFCDVKKIYGPDYVDDTCDVDAIVERIEHSISRAQYEDTIGDVYIADLLYNIVFTYDDGTNAFADVKLTPSPSLWYHCVHSACGWYDSSNVISNLCTLRSVLRGKPHRWGRVNVMTPRNMYFVNTSMYILSRYHHHDRDLMDRLDTLEMSWFGLSFLI